MILTHLSPSPLLTFQRKISFTLYLKDWMVLPFVLVFSALITVNDCYSPEAQPFPQNLLELLLPLGVKAGRTLKAEADATCCRPINDGPCTQAPWPPGSRDGTLRDVK